MKDTELTTISNLFQYCMKVRKCENKIIEKAYCANFITKEALFQHQGTFLYYWKAKNMARTD